MRILKNLLIVVIAIVGIISIIACGAPDENESGMDHDNGTGDCYVHVTATGTKWHSKDCHYLRYSDFIISRERAIREGYDPCLVCGGHCDRSYSSCEPTVKDKEGLPYIDIIFKENYPATEWFYGPVGFVRIDLPPATLTISLRIYPHHIRHHGSSCWTWVQTQLGFYFEAECDGCDELVEWVQDSCYYSKLRFPFRPGIVFEPIGDGLIATVDADYGGSICDKFSEFPCINDESGFVSGWLFLPDEDNYTYNSIDELLFYQHWMGSNNRFRYYIEMFEIR